MPGLDSEYGVENSISNLKPTSSWLYVSKLWRLQVAPFLQKKFQVSKFLLHLKVNAWINQQKSIASKSGLLNDPSSCANYMKDCELRFLRWLEDEEGCIQLVKDTKRTSIPKHTPKIAITKKRKRDDVYIKESEVKGAMRVGSKSSIPPVPSQNTKEMTDENQANFDYANWDEEQLREPTRGDYSECYSDELRTPYCLYTGDSTGTGQFRIDDFDWSLYNVLIEKDSILSIRKYVQQNRKELHEKWKSELERHKIFNTTNTARRYQQF